MGRRQPRRSTAAGRGGPAPDARSRRLRPPRAGRGPGLQDGPVRRRQGLHRPRLAVAPGRPRRSGAATSRPSRRGCAEANNARLLNLARADLVQAMDPEDVRLSEVAYLNASFHFIRIDPS